TLFGRNTTAGIIRFSSIKPTEHFNYRAQTSYGSLGSFSFDGGVGGAIAPGVSVRASALYQRRDDWIDNTFNGDELGSFEELATRFQLALNPNDQLDVLLNVHTRDLDGTAAIFRANVIAPGTNDLNSNYARNRVS